MRFRIVLKGGKELPFKINAPDTDVAVFQARKKLRIANVSHAIPA